MGKLLALTLKAGGVGATGRLGRQAIFWIAHDLGGMLLKEVASERKLACEELVAKGALSGGGLLGCILRSG